MEKDRLRCQACVVSFVRCKNEAGEVIAAFGSGPCVPLIQANLERFWSKESDLSELLSEPCTKGNVQVSDRLDWDFRGLFP